MLRRGTAGPPVLPCALRKREPEDVGERSDAAGGRGHRLPLVLGGQAPHGPGPGDPGGGRPAPVPPLAPLPTQSRHARRRHAPRRVPRPQVRQRGARPPARRPPRRRGHEGRHPLRLRTDRAQPQLPGQPPPDPPRRAGRRRPLADAVAEALFSAYFAEGRDIGDGTVLAAIGDAAGLSPGRAATMLASDELAKEVAKDAARATGLGGVPAVILDRQLIISGAQPAEAMAEAIRAALRTVT
nr:DsbA family protein [Pararoseomonas indoligenes]